MVSQVAQWLSFHFALFLPGSEFPNTSKLSWLLHPLQDLGHGDKVYIVSVQNFIDPLNKGIQEFWVQFEPTGVKEYTEWGTVGFVMPVKVVVQEVVKLIPRHDVGTAVHHRTTRQLFVKVRVISSVQLVHDHFPHGMGPCWTILSISVTLVRHSEVEGVGPQRRIAEGCGDGGVVQEGLFFHHKELVVASNSQVWSPYTHNRIVGDVGESLDYKTHTSHFFSPSLGAGLTPVLFIRVVTAIQIRNGSSITGK